MENTNELTCGAFPAFCREHGLKCTAQRLAVFGVVRNSKRHPSVDETLAAVRKTVPTVTRDSVYRILNEFAALGIVTRLDALSAARYDTWLGPHAHFICEVCGSVTDYPLPADLPIPRTMPKDRRHLELRVTGICDACLRRQATSNGSVDPLLTKQTQKEKRKWNSKVRKPKRT